MNRRQQHELIRQIAAMSDRIHKAMAGTPILQEGLVTYPNGINGPPQPVFLCIGEDRVAWCGNQPGLPVLTIHRAEVVGFMADGQGGLSVTYQPSDYPTQLRQHNPTGEVTAKFIFGGKNAEDFGGCLVEWCGDHLTLRDGGEELAIAEGYMEGIVVDVERYPVGVQAGSKALALVGGEVGLMITPYAALDWYRVGEARAESFAAETLGLSGGEPVIMFSLSEGGTPGRWLVTIRSEDLARWEVIFDHFHVTRS